MSNEVGNGNGTGRRRLLSRRGVAEILNVCERTVSRMQASGRLSRPLQINERAYRWTQDAIDQFLAERAGA